MPSSEHRWLDGPGRAGVTPVGADCSTAVVSHTVDTFKVAEGRR